MASLYLGSLHQRLAHDVFLRSEAFVRLDTLAKAQGLELEDMLEELLDAHAESLALRVGKRWEQPSLFYTYLETNHARARPATTHVFVMHMC